MFIIRELKELIDYPPRTDTAAYVGVDTNFGCDWDAGPESALALAPVPVTCVVSHEGCKLDSHEVL
jgi:hypothetical protein